MIILHRQLILSAAFLRFRRNPADGPNPVRVSESRWKNHVIYPG